MTATVKHYSVLGLTPDASEDEVRQAYRDLLKVWHPDRFTHESERLRKRAEEHCKQLNEAYEAICRSTDRPQRKESEAAASPSPDNFPRSRPANDGRGASAETKPPVQKAKSNQPATFRQIFVRALIGSSIFFVVTLSSEIHNAAQLFGMVFGAAWLALAIALVIVRIRRWISSYRNS